MLAILAFQSCTKHKIKNECCTGRMVVVSGTLNPDSVGIWAPNAITPNFDGLNDVFAPVLGKHVTFLELSVSKGRNTFFQTRVPGAWWDGSYKGKIRPGIYSWSAKLSSPGIDLIEVKGEVCVIAGNVSPEDTDHCKECIFGDMFDPRVGLRWKTSENVGACD
jgi:hypothetical protein